MQWRTWEPGVERRQGMFCPMLTVLFVTPTKTKVMFCLFNQKISTMGGGTSRIFRQIASKCTCGRVPGRWNKPLPGVLDVNIQKCIAEKVASSVTLIKYYSRLNTHNICFWQLLYTSEMIDFRFSVLKFCDLPTSKCRRLQDPKAKKP